MKKKLVCVLMAMAVVVAYSIPVCATDDNDKIGYGIDCTKELKLSLPDAYEKSNLIKKAGCYFGFFNSTIGQDKNNAPVISAETESEDIEEITVADNALQLTEEETVAVLEEMYDDISDTEIEEYDEMETEEIHEKIDNLDEKYELGEPFSEEDSNLLLYSYEKYADNEKEEATNRTVGCVWKSHNIGQTKTKGGVKIGYSGQLKTYSPVEGGTYKTDVNIKVSEGFKNLKTEQWITHHTAYGLLGINVGKDVANAQLGIVYSGSHKSKLRKKGNATYPTQKSLDFEKKTTYNGIWAVYLKTWADLDFTTKSGEYELNTRIYSTWE